jgi:protein involved in temperature-dependent protein secretion
MRKAEDCIDKLKLEKAVQMLDEGIRKFPNETQLLDLYTDLLIQLGENSKAKEVTPYG